MIMDIHTATFADCVLKNRLTRNENGNWSTMPVKAHILYMFSGTETIYSWKNADRKNTTTDAQNRFMRIVSQFNSGI